MKPIIVANWKANKTAAEAKSWTEIIKPNLNISKGEVVIGANYVVLPVLKELFKETPLKLAAQNASNFEQGAYTGEVTAKMLKGIVEYCIVGHSERRKYFGEDEAQIAAKVDLLLKEEITPVLCISDINQMDSYLKISSLFKEQADKIIFVYEPPGAISGGGVLHPESPESANQNAKQIEEKVGQEINVLYGGSVSEKDAGAFLAQEKISGCLVGKTSLDPQAFSQLVKACQT